MKPFEATVEILKAKCGSSSLAVNKENGQALAEFAQEVYHKLSELYDDEQSKAKKPKVNT